VCKCDEINNRVVINLGCKVSKHFQQKAGSPTISNGNIDGNEEDESCTLTLALWQESVPEVAATRDCSIRPRIGARATVREPEACVARGVGDELAGVDVVDRPAVLQLGQVRTPGTYSCRPATEPNEFQKHTCDLIETAVNKC